MVNGRFELYKDAVGEYRFRLKAANGEIIGASEGYTTKANAENGIDSVKKNAENSDQYTIFEGGDGKYYFNLKALNNEIILRSQGYTSKSGAQTGCSSVKAHAPEAQVFDLT